MDPTEGKGTVDGSLPWLWVIEYLASFERVNLQLLYGVIQSAPVLHDELGKNVRELISLRCLEQLCGPANVNETTCDVPGSDLGPMFELSCSCEDALGGILQEGSVSDFRMTGREPLKSQVRQFIIQKRNSMPKPALQQLKDAILGGTRPDAASLKVLSGLACLTDDDRVSVDNFGHCDTSLCESDRRKDNDMNMGPNGNPNSVERDQLEQQLVGDSGTRTSPPSKRNRTVLDAEDSAQNSQENQRIDDDFAVHSPISKKLRQPVPDASQHEKSDCVVIESDSKSDADTEDKFDLAQGQMDTSDKHRTVEECAETYGQQRGSSDRLPDGNEDRIAEKSMPRGDPDTSQMPTDDPSAGEFHQRKTIDEDVEGLMNQQQVEELSSDSDGYLNGDTFDSMKEEFLVSHCISTGDSLESVEQIERNICMKCNEGGQLLVCHTNKCPLAFHENCVDSSANFDENGNFFCHFCQYSNAISKYLEAKKEATSARKDLPAFICTVFEQHPKNLNGMHLDHSGIDEDEHAEVCENHSCVNKVNNRQLQSEEGSKEREGPKLNGETRDEVSAHQLQNDGGSEGRADGSKRNSDLNACSPIEEEEEVPNEVTAGAEDNEENEKNITRTGDQKSDEVGDQQAASPDDINEPPRRPSCAPHVDGVDDSDDDIEDSDADDGRMISNYSISFRRRTNRRVSTSPVAPSRRQRKPPWTEEEVKILKEGVEKFSNADDKTISWKKIMEFGATVLTHGRTAQDLKNKWARISRSPKLK